MSHIRRHNLIPTTLIAVSVLVISLLASCNPDSNSEGFQTHVYGKVTVDTTLDDSGDYAGIELSIVQRDTAIEAADTLATDTTLKDGRFRFDVSFPEKGRYPLLIARGGNRLATSSLILAPKDTIELNAELPNFSDTKEINSREHNAYQAYRRVDKNFNRVRQYMASKGLKGDTLRKEILKWTDIYWSLNTDYKNTLYGKQAALRSVQLLEGWKDKEMLARLDSLENDSTIIDGVSRLGKRARARLYGLDSAMAYLDSIGGRFKSRQINMNMDLQQLELLLDSAKAERARSQLAGMKRDYMKSDTATTDWYDYYSVEVNRLAPGKPFPDFSFATLNADSLHLGQWQDGPYLLEVTSMANSQYQSQYERMLAIHRVFSRTGFNMVTVPLDTSRSMVEAFYQDRQKNWPTVRPNSFDRNEFINKLNIRQVPTRFLVDAEGRIVRKYVGSEIDDVVSDLRNKVKTKEVSL